MTNRWRLGTHNPFTVYRVADGAHDVEHAREHFVCAFRREEDARLAVDAVNAHVAQCPDLRGEWQCVKWNGHDGRHVNETGWQWTDSMMRPMSYEDDETEVAETERAVIHHTAGARDEADQGARGEVFVDFIASSSDRWHRWSVRASEREAADVAAALLPRVHAVRVHRGECGGIEPSTERPAQPTTPPSCDCPTTDGADPAGSTVGQRGAPTRDREALARTAVAQYVSDNPGVPRVPIALAQAGVDVALAALRDGGADGEDADGREPRCTAFHPEYGFTCPYLPNGHGRWHWDPAGGYWDADGQHIDGMDDIDMTRLATTLGVSLDPDDPDPVGRLVEAAGKAREVEVVSGAEAAKLPDDSIYVVCREDGRPMRGHTATTVMTAGWEPTVELSALTDYRVLYRAPAPAAAALAVGDELAGPADVTARAKPGTLVRTPHRGQRGVLTGDFSGGPVRAVAWETGEQLDLDNLIAGCWPMRVLDVPESTVRVGTGGGESGE